MADQVITTKACPRCGGSGHYSYCQMYGTTCFKCGGTGKIPCAPKGQKKIKPTCDDYCKANTGDIVYINKVLFEVGEITWIKPFNKGWDTFNQKMELTRLVDQKKMKTYREFFGYDTTSLCFSSSDGGKTWATGKQNIITPEELIGTPYIPGQFGEQYKITLPKGMTPEQYRKEKGL